MSERFDSPEFRDALAKHAAQSSIPAGTTLSRVHPHIFGSTEFDVRASQDFRFSTIYFRGGVVPVLYASANSEGAACETVFRNVYHGPVIRKPKRVMLQRYATWQWSHLETVAPLRAFHLTEAALSQVGTSPPTVTQSAADVYRQSRQFAEAVLHALPWCQALMWPSSQHTAGNSYVFFGRGAGWAGGVERESFRGLGPSVPFASVEGGERLASVAGPLGITLITG